MKQYSECVFTPVKGSRSCRYCQFSSDPDLFDGCCLVPPDLWPSIKRGEITEDEVYQRKGKTISNI